MANVALYQFIGVNRDELIRRCEDKVATRSGPHVTGATRAEKNHGIPLFLDQLVEELRHGRSSNEDITKASTQHGRDLLRQGFTVSQVVHDYGDVCQSVTDLAMETDAPIATDEFRTLNRCLDDAIAGAVTEHARGQQVTRAGQADNVRPLTDIAIAAFEVLQTGTVGVGGTTGALVLNSLLRIRALVDRPV